MFLKDLETGAFFAAPLLNGGVSARISRTGKDFLQITGKDKTGTIVMMDFSPDMSCLSSLKEANVLYVEGDVDEFNGKKQLKIRKIRPAKEEEYTLSDLLLVEPGYSKDIVPKLRERINEISDKDLSLLTDSLFFEHEALYEKDPAAISKHHSAIGGMAVHVSQVLEIATGILEAMKPVICEEDYESVKDYVTAGSILHDIGKFYEYEKDEYGYCKDYTTEGVLEGHLVIGHDLIKEKAKTLGLDTKKALLLAHILLSHHEKQEWGATVSPATIAAGIVAQADHVSAVLQPFLTGFSDMTSEVSEERNIFGNRNIRVD